MSKKSDALDNLEIISGIADTIVEVEAKAEFNLLQIPLQKIELNEKNKFGVRDIEELSQSLKKYGQLHNAVVRKINDTDDKYKMVSGERRYRAAQMLGWKTLTCKIVKCDDIEEEILLIVANIDTRELNDLERGENAERLVHLVSEKRKQGVDFKGKKTREIVAEKMKVAPATIQKLVKLKKLIPEFKKMVENKEIGLELANQYAQMSEDVQKLVYSSLQEGLKLNAKTAKELKDKIKESQAEHEKVIEDMKKEIQHKTDEAIKAKEESEEKDSSINVLNKELENVQKANDKKESDLKKVREEIKLELEKEMLKNNGDKKKVYELTKKLGFANKEIEDLKENKRDIVREYEGKLKEKKSSNEEIIIRNIEITTLAKQASKILSSLIDKVSDSEIKEFKLNEEAQKSINFIIEQIKILE